MPREGEIMKRPEMLVLFAGLHADIESKLQLTQKMPTLGDNPVDD